MSNGTAIPVAAVEGDGAVSAVLIANSRKPALKTEVTSMSQDLQIRSMRSADVPAAMRLKEAAHWNQVAEDWNGFLEIEASGCFAGELDGEVVTTATNFNYENRFGWIGMILVDPIHRRKGIATRMMNQSISYLESLPCPCQKLDATDAGAKVYEKIGFVTEYQVERWTHPGRQQRDNSDAGLSDLTSQDLSAVEAWDRPIFGASRQRLLNWYVNNPAPSLLLGDPGNPEGFLVGRPGSGAFQVGPMVAATSDAAARLLSGYLGRIGPRNLIADIHVQNPDARLLLEDLGFERSRVLQRMYRGQNDYPGTPEKVYLLAGFEFG